MQCAKFEQRLQQMLDDRQNIEQDETLREHSRGCETCAGILRTQSLLLAGIGSFPESSFGKDLGPRVLEQLRVDRRKRNNKRMLMAALATAAAIMIALLPLAGDRNRFPRIDEQAGGGLALVTPVPQQPSGNRLSERESEEIRLLMHEFVLQISDRRLTMFEPVDQLANGIRPLAATFNFALDALRRTLPGYSQPQPVEPQALHRAYRTSIS